ncbi:MAG: A/G-specific adenine glycosylase [Verrucomicrobiota bacterium]|nr:A/G-specific adenine glycosylase [Verrucomicrobiota bacterium]
MNSVQVNYHSLASRCLAGRLAEMSLRSIVAPLLKWFAENARDLPWRRTRDPYAIWVSEIMLQQTQVKTVIPYWERWIKKLPDITALADAKEETVFKLWDGLGYYSRVRNMQKAARLIRDLHKGRFPSGSQDILELPGVGRYTCGAVCSIAYNQPEPIVDGNVIRVISRVAGIDEPIKSKPVMDRIWSYANDLVKHAIARQKPGQRNASAFNQSMMELGAMVCTPRNPICSECPLKGRCEARKKNKIDYIPTLVKRAAVMKRRYIGFIIIWNGKVFVQRRLSGGVNAGFWEFPNWQVDANVDPADFAKGNLSLNQVHLELLIVINHSITRYRNRLEMFILRVSRKPCLGRLHGEWVPMAKIDKLPLTGAHRKATKYLQD